MVVYFGSDWGKECGTSVCMHLMSWDISKGVDFPQIQTHTHAHTHTHTHPLLLQMGLYDDKIGPTVIACLVLMTLVVIFVLALYDYIY